MSRRTGARIAAAALVCGALAGAGNGVVTACTAFCAEGAGQVLVGNNEDWYNPRTKIWFVPAANGSYGRVYTGFADLTPQGGMNERGLWFDGFATPPVSARGSSGLPPFPGNIVDAAMAECGTVEEVVRLFSRYDRSFLAEAILMFADAAGDAVSIERNAIVRKTGRHFIQTNFHQSLSRRGTEDGRYATASEMLDRAGDDISTDLFRRILAATHQVGGSPTLYSNIYDLRSRTMLLYHFHDFDHVVTFRLDDELKKAARVLDIPALFPPNAAAETFAALQNQAGASSGSPATVVLLVFPLVLLTIAGYAWTRGNRQLRLGILVFVASIAAVLIGCAVVLSMHGTASGQWMQFSIAPASGESASLQPGTMRSSGITLKVALATAYDVPSVRVIGPAWLADTRYSITAVAGVDAEDSFRALLQQELKNRLRLETHFEVRPFDVFVLTATDAPRLERSRGKSLQVWIDKQNVRFRDASMDAVATGLQSVLGRPVIDETAIAGTYDLELAWGEDRVAAVTDALRERFGLRLSPGRREMEALIVDRIQRDAALVLLAEIGRISRVAPPDIRRRIANIMTIR